MAPPKNPNTFFLSYSLPLEHFEQFISPAAGIHQKTAQLKSYTA
jgi:hypothetical protein